MGLDSDGIPAAIFCSEQQTITECKPCATIPVAYQGYYPQPVQPANDGEVAADAAVAVVAVAAKPAPKPAPKAVGRPAQRPHILPGQPTLAAFLMHNVKRPREG